MSAMLARSVSVSVFLCMTTRKYLFAGLVVIHTISFDQGYEHCTTAKKKPGAPTISSVEGYINLQFMVERGKHSSVNGRASSGATESADRIHREQGQRGT